jgi:hypothetical protein
VGGHWDLPAGGPQVETAAATEGGRSPGATALRGRRQVCEREDKSRSTTVSVDMCEPTQLSAARVLARGGEPDPLRPARRDRPVGAGSPRLEAELQSDVVRAAALRAELTIDSAACTAQGGP